MCKRGVIDLEIFSPQFLWGNRPEGAPLDDMICSRTRRVTEWVTACTDAF